MNKDIQTQVRVMAEQATEYLYKQVMHPQYPDLSPSQMQLVFQLEVSRQLSLLTEEVRRLSKKLDEWE